LRRGGGQRLPNQERQPIAAQALKQRDIGKIGGIEGEDDVAWRKNLLRQFGYKL
jgi:hypothetical protein